ncbi:MAG: class I SAM-dependent methyltransferase [Syntrophaceae bacterium]|nr:class I SAM-dependent methyltransferase [Syntrophaceae bacterium]
MSYREVLFREYTNNIYRSMISISEASYTQREHVFKKRFSKFLPSSKDAAILDIGCGLGFFLWFLQQGGYTNVVGIDVSPQQIEVAENHGVKGLQLCDWKTYLVDKHSQFDFILLDNVIEHLHKDEIVEMLARILLSLKPGGRVYVSTPNAGSPFGIAHAFIDFTHEVYFTPASLSQVILSCGFSSVYVFGEPLFAVDILSFLRKTVFNIIKPFIKAAYIIGAGGGGRTHISHYIEPIIAAFAEKPIARQ